MTIQRTPVSSRQKHIAYSKLAPFLLANVNLKTLSTNRGNNWSDKEVKELLLIRADEEINRQID